MAEPPAPPDGSDPQSPSAAERAELRRRFRKRRATLGRLQRQAWAARLNRHLLSADALREAGAVAGYLAFDGEPDVRFTLTQLCRRGVAVALPVLPGAGERALGFRAWTPATPLDANRWGISEPRGTGTVAAETLDVVLVPLVAFDRSGGRLGMGAGWYDRTFADAATRPLLVGVAWSLQEAPALTQAAWDVPLHAVVTEQGWFTCRD